MKIPKTKRELIDWVVINKLRSDRGMFWIPIPNLDMLVTTVLSVTGAVTAGISGGLTYGFGAYGIIRGISWVIGYLDHTRWKGWERQQKLLNVELTTPIKDLIASVERIEEKVNKK